MDNRLKTIEEYCEFTNDTCYLLLMLPRKKENQENTERDKLKKRIRFLVRNMDDVKHALDEFDRTAELYPEVVFRVYLSVNRRSLIKGMMEFQKKLVDLQYDIINGSEVVYNAIAKLGSEFKSVIASKKCRADRNFMFDIDYRNDVEEDWVKVNSFLLDVSEHTETLYFGESKNGYCLVTKPFNPNLVKLDELIERKDDAYMYISCMNDKGE